jgi:phosphotransferase system enzyme I (PtsP)
VLEHLRSITSELNQAASLDAALATVVRKVKEAMAVDVCSVYLLDASGARCILMATDGLDPKAVGRIQFKQREGLVGLVLESGRSLQVTNAQRHPRFRFFPEFGEAAYPTFLGVPLVHFRRVLGVLAVRQSNERGFSSEEEAFLMAVGAELAGLGHDVTGGVAGVSSTGVRSMPAVLTGIRAAPGIGIGIGVLAAAAAEIDDVPDCGADDLESEEAAFRDAVAAVRAELRSSGERMGARAPTEAHAMFQLYAALLDDREMFADTLERIRGGTSAPVALRASIAEQARVFEAMSDPYLQARAEDIRGLGRRVLLRLQKRDTRPRQYPARCVLVGEEISIAPIADVPLEQLKGLLCTRGSPYSHVAILARTLRIPAVMNIGDVPIAQLDGRELLIDGHQGRVFIEPAPAVRAEFEGLLRQQEQRAAGLAALASLRAETRDGARVSLLANAGLQSDLPFALEVGAEGIGLYRTEFTFMVSDGFPGEDDQAHIYGDVLATFVPRPVTMRTLDIGGDKVLPYFSMSEDNPLLGWRGIRVTLDNPGIFLTQLRAMIRANAGHGNLRLLLPMISTCEEADAALQLIERACSELSQGGQPITRPPVGVMIEVPSAIYQIPVLARRVDFFSIGSNDLTQYLLAVDRNNARIARCYDSLHPAVLRAVDQAVNQARESSKPMSVCGEMAGDPASAILLLGMGVETLSMAASSLPRVKQTLRALSRRYAAELLRTCLDAENAAEVRRTVDDALARAGLLDPTGAESTTGRPDQAGPSQAKLPRPDMKGPSL